MTGCVFCAIVAGDAPAHVVDEDEHTIAFLDIAPFTRGHTLVVPRDHHADLWDVPADTWAAVTRAVHRVADHIHDRLEPDGLNLLQATRPVAFQTVFHIHVHVIPRWHDDGISVPPWPKPTATSEQLSEVAAALR
jgi:histidine triad (HIT) family protein